DALARMDLQSQSWEYASEMVLKSVHMRLRTCEVPVSFLRDRDGRVSHHKRLGWFSPWQAAWINLRAMFIYGADFFVFKPGLFLVALGLLLTLPLSLGPVTVGPITFSLYWMLSGVTLCLLGLQSFFLGCIARLFYDYTGTTRRRLLSVFRYTRTVVVSAILSATGVVLASFLVVKYIRNSLSLPAETARWPDHLAVTGLLFLIAGFMTFTFTLLLHAAA